MANAATDQIMIDAEKEYQAAGKKKGGALDTVLGLGSMIPGYAGLAIGAIGLVKGLFEKDPAEEYRKNIQKMQEELGRDESRQMESLRLNQSQSQNETQRRIQDTSAASGLPQSLAAQNIWRSRMEGERNLMGAMAQVKDYTLKRKMELLQMQGQAPQDTSSGDLLSTGLSLASMAFKAKKQ